MPTTDPLTGRRAWWQLSAFSLFVRGLRRFWSTSLPKASCCEGLEESADAACPRAVLLRPQVLVHLSCLSGRSDSRVGGPDRPNSEQDNHQSGPRAEELRPGLRRLVRAPDDRPRDPRLPRRHRHRFAGEGPRLREDLAHEALLVRVARVRIALQERQPPRLLPEPRALVPLLDGRYAGPARWP